MKPILYPSTATTFNNNGLGALSDAISCVVTEQRNGEYELTMQYPVGGVHYDEIGDRCIILAIPSPYRDPQPFRIYQKEINIDGILTVHARHVSYDLSGIAVSPFTAGDCAAALSGLLSNSVGTNNFTAWTDKSVSGTYSVTLPTSFRSCLGGQENSILDVYGKGEYEFDKFNIKLYTNRGSDNGVVIAYGKNLTSFEMERNLDSVVTAVYPYWADMEGNNLVEIDGKVIQLYDPTNPIYLRESGGAFLAEATQKLLAVHTVFSYDNIMVLDLSTEFEEQPTKRQLFDRARKYIIDNQLAVPKVSITASFVQLEQTEEYRDIAPLERVDLCDTVTVRFPLVGIEVYAKIIEIETDVLLERYNKVEIGDARVTLPDTLAQASMAVTQSELRKGMASAADTINNTHGTFEFIDNGDGTNGGFTIYEDNDTAFLRCTAGGIGLSQDGGLTYTNAITKNGVTATNLNVRANGVSVLRVYYNDSAKTSVLQFNNPETGGLGFYLASTLMGSGIHLYKNDGQTEILGLSSYTGNGGAGANNQLHIDDPRDGRTAIHLISSTNTNNNAYSNMVAVYGALDDPNRTDAPLGVEMYSGYNSGSYTNRLSLAYANTRDTTAFYVISNATNNVVMMFNGHYASWKTATINGTTYHYLGY